MSENEERIINTSKHNAKLPANNGFSVEEKITGLVKEQLFGILCTQSNGQPYGSMIGLAFSDDLKYAVFATPTATRKYKNLTHCKDVALVINNRDKYPTELMKIEAFTAIGKAEEIIDKEAHSRWAKLLMNRHSYFKEFLKSPRTALFYIQINKYFYVCSFQDVREWVPE